MKISNILLVVQSRIIDTAYDDDNNIEYIVYNSIKWVISDEDYTIHLYLCTFI